MTLLDIVLLMGTVGIIGWFATKGKRRQCLLTEERVLRPGGGISINTSPLLKIPPAPKGAKPYFLCFDTETANLIPCTEAGDSSPETLPRIVALSYNLLDQEGRLVFTESLLLRAKEVITPQAFEIHNISNEDIMARGIPPKAAYRKFGEALKLAKLFVAHNLEIHRKLLDADVSFYGLPALDWEGKEPFCTMKKGFQYLIAHDPYYIAAEPALRTLYGLLYYERSDLRYFQTNKSEADLLLATACLRFLRNEL